MGRSLRALLVFVFLLGCAFCVGGAGPKPGAAQVAERPNVLLVLTDDQSAETLRYMPEVRRRLVGQGTTFENYAISLATCCPSRSTMLRGQYFHNTGISGAPGADAVGFARRGLDRSTVATWLDTQGYSTALFGKYLNGYRQARYVPPGWDTWHANASRDVWAECLAENGRERCYEGQNPDAVLAKKAEGFVRYAARRKAPFFAWVSMNAPHQYYDGPPIWAKEDDGKFRRAPLPSPPNFDEADVSDKPPWMQRSRLAAQEVRSMGVEHRARLRSLQLVDRTVGRLLAALAASGELDNTYVVFTTDNGYHLGQHRMVAGKHMPYLEDVNFPLIIRGPGVARGATREELVVNTDFAPTVADLAGASAATPGFVDGRSFAPLLAEGGAQNVPWRDTVLLEGFPSRDRPSYSGLWTGGDGGYWYVEYETGEGELYDLATDPYQLQNVAGEARYAEREAALEARLGALRNCAGAACRAAENAP